MKTTIDISTTLFKEAKRVAHENKNTLKEIVESALRMFLKTHRRPSPLFKLKRHTFRGRGLVEGINEGDWSIIRARAYEGRGG